MYILIGIGALIRRRVPDGIFTVKLEPFRKIERKQQNFWDCSIRVGTSYFLCLLNNLYHYSN